MLKLKVKFPGGKEEEEKEENEEEREEIGGEDIVERGRE